jgi:hypothetical protein
MGGLIMAKYTGAIHKVCNRCDGEPGHGEPGQWVQFYEDKSFEALCFACYKPLIVNRAIRVIYWINKYGKEMYAPGSNTP